MSCGLLGIYRLNRASLQEVAEKVLQDIYQIQLKMKSLLVQWPAGQMNKSNSSSNHSTRLSSDNSGEQDSSEHSSSCAHINLQVPESSPSTHPSDSNSTSIRLSPSLGDNEDVIPASLNSRNVLNVISERVSLLHQLMVSFHTFIVSDGKSVLLD